MSIVAPPCLQTGTASFEEAWQRLSQLLEDPPSFAIQFVFSSNYALHSALLQRLQQTAHSRGISCLELPETAATVPEQNQAAPATAQQLAETITRDCLARILPAPPQPRLLLLDLHQALPRALAALLPEPGALDDTTPSLLQQAITDSRALLLSRLNERRAQLAPSGPVLILLPEDWTKPAAQYAPDLWTMRLSSLYLPLPPLADAEAEPHQERNAEPVASPRAAERKILERWQAALRTGQTQGLPIADGWIAAQTSAKLGNGQEAERIAALCLQLAYQRGGLPEQMVSQNILGDMRLRRGALEQAHEAYSVALTLTQKLLSNEPDNTQWQRDLSVSYGKVADILRRSDPAAALAHYQSSLKIARDLAQREPNNTQWQRDLSVSYNKVADVLRRSDPATAFAHYKASLKIRQALARLDPDNTERQRDLSVSYNKLADIMCRRDPTAALAHYQSSLKIAQDLARREPDNTQYQRDLSISHNKVADILRSSDLSAALAHYRDSLKIRQDLARHEPDNTQYQRDLSVSYGKLANILQRSDPAAALANYETGLKITQDLARREPDNLLCQTDLVISYVKMASLHPTIPTADARAYLQAALDCALSLQQRGLLDQDQKNWPNDLRQRLAALPPD